MAVERFPIEAGHIMLFARAVGDPNPIYYDPERAIAPPTFVQASAQFDPDYGLRPKIGRPWFGSGKTPSGLQRPAPSEGSSESRGGSSGGGGGGGERRGGGGGTGLHAEQHYEYHRPLRVGDVLSATTRPGERWEKQGRSGTLVFTEAITEYRDAGGHLVVTARGVGVMTERPVAQEG